LRKRAAHGRSVDALLLDEAARPPAVDDLQAGDRPTR